MIPSAARTTLRRVGCKSVVQAAHLWIGLVLLSLGHATAHAQSSAVPEYGLKAVLLHKLPEFTYLTRKPGNAPVTLCVLGANPFGDALDKLTRDAGDKPARTARQISGTHQAAGCDVVFVERGESERIDGILQRLASRSVLTVSDITGFARLGGMVELTVGGERPGVGLVINRKAARAQGIDFNAQLLRLATLVEP